MLDIKRMPFKVLRNTKLLVGICLLLPHLALAAKSERAAFSNELQDHLNKQRELLHNRLELENKWLDWAKRSRPNKKGDSINDVQGYTSSKTQEQKIAKLKAELASIEDELRRLKDPNSAQELIGLYQRKDTSATQCALGDCLRTLSDILELGTQIALVNNKIIEKEFLALSAVASRQRKTKGTLELALANLDLERASFECERTLADLRYDSWIQPQGIAECFYSITKEYEPKLGAPDISTEWWNLAFLLESKTSLENPQDSTSKFATGLESPLASFIMTLPAYSGRPEMLFRKAYELSRGNVYVTLRTLFNTLRLHRTDQDFQRKLIDIRGDRPAKGRNAGDWYHFFGTMLAEQLYGVKWATKGLAGDNPGGGEKKAYTNNAGIDAMARFEKMVKTKANVSKPNPCDLKNLLSNGPDKRLESPKDPK